MKLRLFIIIVTVVSCLSCSSSSEGSSYVDLGNGFKYIKEYPQTIIYSTSNESPSSGKNVIDPIVISYGLHDDKIFAISRGEPAVPTKNRSLYGEVKYWIIDKRDDVNKLQPVDSTFFYAELNRLELKLNNE